MTPQHPIDNPPQAWIDAARFERDRRAERYPAMVADGKLGGEEATVDYQAWCVIAGWLETGQLRTIEGGLDGRTIVDWALAEAAAEKALAKITAKAAALPEGAPAFAETHRRRALLLCIHRAVALRRHSIEIINRQMRSERSAAPVGADRMRQKENAT